MDEPTPPPRPTELTNERARNLSCVRGALYELPEANQEAIIALAEIKAALMRQDATVAGLTEERDRLGLTVTVLTAERDQLRQIGYNIVARFPPASDYWVDEMRRALVDDVRRRMSRARSAEAPTDGR